MASDIKLKDGTVELTGDKVRADVGFDGGSVEFNGSNLITTVTDVAILYRGGHLKTQNEDLEISGKNLKTSSGDLEMYYRGGHLIAKDENVELGSTDSGTFKGFKQSGNGNVLITSGNGSMEINGDRLQANVSSVEIGNRASGKFKGIYLSLEGTGQRITCHADHFAVLNPDVKPDQQQRTALSQSTSDELLINANSYYKGGVKLDGAVKISDLTVLKSITVPAAGKLLLKTRPQIIGGEARDIDVMETINQLWNKIQELSKRIAALEAK